MFISTADNVRTKQLKQLWKGTENSVPSHRGYFVLSCFDGRRPFNRYSNSRTALLHYAMDNPYKNWFMTSNSVKYPFNFNQNQHKWFIRKNARSANNLADISAFYVDLDVSKYMNLNDFDEYVVYKVANTFTPNITVFSGHGYHYIFLLNRQYYVNSLKFVKAWKNIEQQLLDSIKKAVGELYGKQYEDIVDTHCSDPTRVLRVPLTINVKRQPYQFCHVIDTSFTKHTFADWSKKYPAKKHTYQRRTYRRNRKRNHTKTTVVNPRNHKFSLFSLAWNRVKDLHHLASLRHYHLDNNRDELLFLMATQLIHVESPQSTYSDIKKMNHELKEKGDYPLENKGMLWLKSEILKHTDHFMQYKYKTSSIIDLLGISPKEQQYMLTLKVSHRSTDYLHRQAHLKRVKKQRKHDLLMIGKINQLEINGSTQSNIAQILHTSRKTINRIKERLKPIPMHDVRI